MVAIEVDLKLVVILILLIGSLIWRINEEVNEKSLLQSDISKIKKTLTELQTENSEIKMTLTEVQRENSEIKMTLSQVQMEILDMKTTLIGRINTFQRLDIILNSLRKTLTTMFLSFKNDTDMLGYKMDEMKDACSPKTSMLENILAIVCALLKSIPPFLFGIGTQYLSLCDLSLWVIRKVI